MTSHASPSPSDLDDEAAAERASARITLPRRAWWWIAAGLVALIAGASLWGWWVANKDVRWRDVGFDVDSPHRVTVTFDVFVYTDRPITCHLQALNVHFAEVGIDTVLVDPDAGDEQRITRSFTTTEQATTATVDYCETAS